MPPRGVRGAARARGISPKVSEIRRFWCLRSVGWSKDLKGTECQTAQSVPSEGRKGHDREDPAMKQDADQLKLLSIFHYVVAGLAALFSLFPILHLLLGVAMVTGTLEGTDRGARMFGWFFVFFSATFILFGLAFAVTVFIAGRSLAGCTRYMYCLVMAGTECIFMPFGTVLGVFTIIVLLRDSVKRRFGVETEQDLTGGSLPSAPAQAG